MNAKLCLPPEIAAQNVVGLLGSPNGIKADDWMDHEGKALERSNNGKGKAAFEYCTSQWCVDDEEESIFYYLNGTNFTTYNKCNNVYDPTAVEMLKNATPQCITDCDDERFDGADDEDEFNFCLTDCMMGTEDDAIIELQEEKIMKFAERQCVDGPEIFPVPPPMEIDPPVIVIDPPVDDPIIKIEKEEEEEEEEPPITAKSGSGGAFGDPHVRTWSGEHYSYHGACDLVLMQNPDFANGLGMDIHIRNKRVKRWSYIDTAAIRIGSDILEVKGGKTTNEFWVNGVQGNPQLENGVLEQTVAGYKVKFDWLTQGRRRFVIDLGNGEEVIFKTFKYFVRVNLKAKQEDNFKSSVGLMGTYPEGKKVARDHSSVIEDYDQFGQEWQVAPGEPMLFHNVEGAQAPAQCEMPIMSTQRRLAESSISLEDAEIACAHVNLEDRDECIFDVLATEDKDMAGAY